MSALYFASVRPVVERDGEFTYRIATGKHAVRKVVTLQTLPGGNLPRKLGLLKKWNFLVDLMKKSRFTGSQIIAVLKQAESGTPVPELCRANGISSATFYK